jgi:hypothetical protein
MDGLGWCVGDGKGFSAIFSAFVFFSGGKEE